MNINNEDEVLDFLSRLLERLQQAGGDNHSGSPLTFVYVAKGGQNVGSIQNQYLHPDPEPHPSPLQRRGSMAAEGCPDPDRGGALEERIRQCIALLMTERYGDEPLFNQQSHWQAVYRILVDKGYCRDSDFDGFDTFIRRVMPDCVNKPYKKDSVKRISQTDFVKPFAKWAFDTETSKTRKPYDRMVAVATRLKEILEENGL